MSYDIKAQARDRLIVAVDVSTAAQALALVSPLRGEVGWVKVGKQLFVAEGPTIVRTLREAGFRVFLDLKFHDIPNTVAAAGLEAMRLGVDLFNVHASGGRRMMAETAKRVRDESTSKGVKPPKVIAVTVLTSLEAKDLGEIGLAGEPESWVMRWAKLAGDSGLDGVVCSPLETKALRAELGNRFLLVTPGIRAADAPPDDQRRTLPAAEAIACGASMLVIGRPLTQAPDPIAAARAFAAEVATALPPTLADGVW